MRYAPIVAISAALLAVAPEANACSCSASPAPFCATDLDALAASGRTLVFIGTVTNTVAATTSVPPPSPRSSQARPLNPSQMDLMRERRDAALALYGDALPEAERAALLVQQDVFGLADELSWIEDRQRSQVRVEELFIGDVGPEIQIVDTNNTSCSYQYKVGQTYLFEARQDGRGRWVPLVCTGRASTIDSAEDNIRSLRAWKSGQTLPSRIYGKALVMGRFPTAVRFGLRGEVPMETILDEDDRFSFDNLQPGRYEFEMLTPGRMGLNDKEVFGPYPIDLTSGGCAELAPLIGPLDSR